MRLVVSGASGYVGTAVCKLAVKRGHSVTALIRPNSDKMRLTAIKGLAVAEIDPNDYESIRMVVEECRPSATLHLAGLTDPRLCGAGASKLIAANITLGSLLCEALADVGCGIVVNAASFWEFSEGTAPAVFRPNSLYAATKAAFRTLLIHYSTNHGFRVLNLVLYDIIGPGDWRDKLWNALAFAVATQQPMGLTPGDQLLDLVDVRDVAEAFLVAAHVLQSAPDGENAVYAVNSGTRASLRDVVAAFGEVLGHAPQIDWGRRDYPSFQVFDPNESLPRLPGWEPRIPRRQSIADLAAHR